MHQFLKFTYEKISSSSQSSIVFLSFVFSLTFGAVKVFSFERRKFWVLLFHPFLLTHKHVLKNTKNILSKRDFLWDIVFALSILKSHWLQENFDRSLDGYDGVMRTHKEGLTVWHQMNKVWERMGEKIMNKSCKSFGKFQQFVNCAMIQSPLDKRESLIEWKIHAKT